MGDKYAYQQQARRDARKDEKRHETQSHQKMMGWSRSEMRNGAGSDADNDSESETAGSSEDDRRGSSKSNKTTQSAKRGATPKNQRIVRPSASKNAMNVTSGSGLHNRQIGNGNYNQRANGFAQSFVSQPPLQPPSQPSSQQPSNQYNGYTKSEYKTATQRAATAQNPPSINNYRRGHGNTTTIIGSAAGASKNSASIPPPVPPPPVPQQPLPSQIIAPSAQQPPTVVYQPVSNTQISVSTHCRDLDSKELLQYQQEYYQNRIVVIPQFLNKSFAQGLRIFLDSQVPANEWYLTANGASKPNNYTDSMEKRFTQSPGETNIPLAFVSPKSGETDQLSALLTKRWNEAGEAINDSGMSYRFYRTMGHAQLCNCIQCTLQTLMKSSDFLGYIDSLTASGNDPQIAGLTTSFASRYRSGCFLGIHGDNGRGKVAFVLNLTSGWKSTYGGALTMLEPDWSTPKRVISPDFNSLVLFEVKDKGTPHFVSQVAENVKGERIAISGWFNTNSSTN